MKIITILAGVVFLTSCRVNNQQPFVTGKENKKMIDFNILLPDSSTYVNTASITEGKKIILFYYSPSCPYCRAQMREMLNNIDLFKDAQLCVVTDANFSSMKAFNKYFKLQEYSNILTGVDTGFVVLRNYRAFSVPFTAVFDKNKHLTSAYLGRITGKTLLKVTHP